jgi:hypothetical protein
MAVDEVPDFLNPRHKKLRKLSPIFLGHSVALFVEHGVNDGSRGLAVFEGAGAGFSERRRKAPGPRKT